MARAFLAASLALASIAPAPGAAQQTVERISMSEALERFGSQSLELRIARAEAAEASGIARQTRAWDNPVLGVNTERLDRDDGSYSETIAGLAQRVEWPGRIAARGRAADHRVASASAGFHADSTRLVFDVRSAYVAAWAAEARAAAIRRSVDVIRQVATAAERRLEEGDISGFEVRRLGLERIRSEQDAARVELAASTARRTLAVRISAGDAVREVGPATPISGLPPAVARQDALAAVEGRPDLRSAARAEEAARAEAAVAAMGWIPAATFSVGAKDQSDGFAGPVFGVALPLPLFDRRGGDRQAAEARADAAAATLDLRRRAAMADVLRAIDRYEAMREQLGGMGDQVLEDADALLASARAAWQEGEISLVELLDAARAFRDALDGAVALRAEVWIAYYDLMRAMGRAPEGER